MRIITTRLSAGCGAEPLAGFDQIEAWALPPRAGAAATQQARPLAPLPATRQRGRTVWIVHGMALLYRWRMVRQSRGS